MTPDEPTKPKADSTSLSEQDPGEDFWIAWFNDDGEAKIEPDPAPVETSDNIPF
jgi:hypothetical protein